jgi:PIN domain
MNLDNRSAQFKKKTMVNLILDTNSWIYLSNGFNPDTLRNDEESHFQIAKWILERIENGKCRIFSNYIIKIEWNRNKEKTNVLIIRYEDELKKKSNELKKKRKSSDYLKFAKEFRNIENEIKDKISKNKIHIHTIEGILNNSIEIPVNDKQKLKAVDLAINKKPPFHQKDNSVADAIIFLSTIDYFYYDEEFYIDDTIFISNNTSDFSESVTNKELHPELAKMLRDKPIVFETNLAKALSLGDEIIAKYQKYIDYLNRDCIGCLMNCKGVEYGMAEVEFNDFVEIEIEKSGYKYTPEQLLLNFGENYKITADELKAIEKRNYIRVEIGECDFCNATHIRCDCGEEHASYGDDIECSCGKSFNITNGIKLTKEE